MLNKKQREDLFASGEFDDLLCKSKEELANEIKDLMIKQTIFSALAYKELRELRRKYKKEQKEEIKTGGDYEQEK